MDAIGGMDLLQSLTKIQAGKSANTQSGKSENPELKKACQDFESIFVTQLLKTMRQSFSEEDGLFGKDFGGEMFRDLFDQEIAQDISRGQGMGLARQLYESLEKYAPAEPKNIEFPRGFKPPVRPAAVNIPERVQSYQNQVHESGRKYGVEPALLLAMMTQESGGNAGAVSGKGAKGLMQLMDGTAREMGVKNVYDPAENIAGGAKYIRKMLDQFDGDKRLALAAYNAGPGAVKKYSGIPPYKETIHYVNRVMDLYESYTGPNASKRTLV